MTPGPGAVLTVTQKYADAAAYEHRDQQREDDAWRTVRPNYENGPRMPPMKLTGMTCDDGHRRRGLPRADTRPRPGARRDSRFAHTHVPDDVSISTMGIIDSDAGDELIASRLTAFSENPRITSPQKVGRIDAVSEHGNRRRAKIAEENQNDDDRKDCAFGSNVCMVARESVLV